MRALFWLPLLLMVSSCDMFANCTTEAIPGLHMKLVDSITGGPASAPDLMVVATSGSFADTLRFPPYPTEFIPNGLAYERPGTYRVEATGTGYHPWVRSGVRVKEDGCHVRTVSLTALMQPVHSP